jgi:hypothetical protein
VTSNGVSSPVNGSVLCAPPASNSNTRSLSVSATNTSPDASTAMPPGKFRLVNGSVLCAPPAGNSTTRLLAESATNTSPDASSAMPSGELRPVNGSVTCEPPAGNSITRPLLLSTTNTSPEASTAMRSGTLRPVNGSVVCEPPAATAPPRYCRYRRRTRRPRDRLRLPAARRGRRTATSAANKSPLAPALPTHTHGSRGGHGSPHVSSRRMLRRSRS